MIQKTLGLDHGEQGKQGLLLIKGGRGKTRAGTWDPPDTVPVGVDGQWLLSRHALRAREALHWELSFLR